MGEIDGADRWRRRLVVGGRLGRTEVVAGIALEQAGRHHCKSSQSMFVTIALEGGMEVEGLEDLTSTLVVLAGCLRRTGRTVHRPVRAGNRRVEVDRNYRLVPVDRSSDHILLLLVEEGIGPVVADRRSLDMEVAVVGRIGLPMVDSLVGEDSRLAQVGSLDRSRVVDSLGCSLADRIDRKELT